MSLKSKAFILTIIAAFAFAGCGRPAKEEPAERMPKPEDAPFRVSFRVNFFPVQKALWIQDEAGNYIRTLHVSEWLRGWGEEYGVLTDWVEASKEARRKKPGEKIDAFTEATLRAREQKFSYGWDLTRWSGEKVPEGKYRVILQCDGAEGIVVTWSADIYIGEEPARVELTPSPAELPQGLEMYLEDVTAEYRP